jgi:hypothetical protein
MMTVLVVDLVLVHTSVVVACTFMLIAHEHGVIAYNALSASALIFEFIFHAVVDITLILPGAYVLAVLVVLAVTVLALALIVHYPCYDDAHAPKTYHQDTYQA